MLYYNDYDLKIKLNVSFLNFYTLCCAVLSSTFGMCAPVSCRRYDYQNENDKYSNLHITWICSSFSKFYSQHEEQKRKVFFLISSVDLITICHFHPKFTILLYSIPLSSRRLDLNRVKKGRKKNIESFFDCIKTIQHSRIQIYFA